jgi:uncharacterized protein YycO
MAVGGPVTAPMSVALGAPQPGNYGVSHGTGMIGELIRHATESWAGHAFIYIGHGTIVEAGTPATRLAPAASHPDAVWNLNEPLTNAQRDAIVSRARALVGTSYDYPAYIGFALEVLHLRTGKQLAPEFQRDHWRVCSADVADAYAFAGIDLTAGLKVPNLVSPADLYDRIAKQAGTAS